MASELKPCFSQDDTRYGTKFVYCDQHLRVHATGWCTVSCINKIPLLADTESEAVAEWEMKKRVMNIKV
jgi:hypothetical protein